VGCKIMIRRIGGEDVSACQFVVLCESFSDGQACLGRCISLVGIAFEDQMTRSQSVETLNGVTGPGRFKHDDGFSSAGTAW
jgi:hypothetical protein